MVGKLHAQSGGFLETADLHVAFQQRQCNVRFESGFEQALETHGGTPIIARRQKAIAFATGVGGKARRQCCSGWSAAGFCGSSRLWWRRRGRRRRWTRSSLGREISCGRRWFV